MESDSHLPLEISDTTEARLLLDDRDELAELLKFGAQDSDRTGSDTIEKAARELAGIIFRTASIEMHGGFIPLPRVRPQLQQIEAAPDRFFRAPDSFHQDTVGLVLSMVRFHEISRLKRFQNEEPGTWWMCVSEIRFDTLGPKNRQRVCFLIERAAARAFQDTEASKPRLRTGSLALAYVTLALREIFLRHNGRIGRDLWEGNSDWGPFARFVELVCDDWNAAVKAGKLGRKINADTVARNAADLRWVRRFANRVAGFTSEPGSWARTI